MLINKLLHRITWEYKKKSFKSIGNNAHVGKNFIFDNANNIEIGDNFSAQNNIKMRTWEIYNSERTGYNPHIKIGNNVSFMNDCFVSCLNSVEIGDGCLFGDNVFITDNYHGNTSLEDMTIIPLKRKLYSKGNIKIGKNIWCGRNVCIMSGVSIGNNVIIGANSVVTHSFTDNVVIAGAPAKIIKKV